MIFFRVEDIDHKGKNIGTPCKGHTDHHIKSDPYSPRKLLRKIGDRTQSFCQTDDDEDETQKDDR